MERARAEEEEQFDRYRLRVRTVEERGSWAYISVLFKATSLSDLLSRWNDVFDILSHDQNLREEYVAVREAAEQVQAEYELAQEQQREKQAELAPLHSPVPTKFRLGFFFRIRYSKIIMIRNRRRLYAPSPNRVFSGSCRE